MGSGRESGPALFLWLSSPAPPSSPPLDCCPPGLAGQLGRREEREPGAGAAGSGCSRCRAAAGRPGWQAGRRGEGGRGRLRQRRRRRGGAGRRELRLGGVSEGTPPRPPPDTARAGRPSEASFAEKGKAASLLIRGGTGSVGPTEDKQDKLINATFMARVNIDLG